MGNLNTLSNFFEFLFEEASNNEKPETILVRDNISELFLSFVDRFDDENGGSEYYRKWYEEKNKENAYSDLNDFICTYVLSIRSKFDVRAEYIRLKEEAIQYMDLLQSKKKAYEEQLKSMGNKEDNQKRKIVYFKQIVEKTIKKAKKKSDTKELVRMAINISSMPSYIGWFDRGFGMDILSAQDIGTDKRDLIYFGELPVTDAEQMLLLRNSDKNAYLNAFDNMILSMQIVEKIEEIVRNNFYLRNREKILLTAMELFDSENYESFVYLIVPQIEGLFRIYLRLLGDNSHSDGMQEIAKKIKEKEDFFEFVYFAYDFSDLRNRIAHGDMIEVGREQAYEVLMDTYWIIKEIDSDQRDYKLWFDLIEKCSECLDLSGAIKKMLEYFVGLDAEKYMKLLKRHFCDDFKNEITWYNLDDQVAKWDSMIRDRSFYEAIWSEGALEINDGSVEIEGKNYIVMKYNNEGLKYQVLVEELQRQCYVPEDWYKQYVIFGEKMEELQKKRFQELGIDNEEVLLQI